VLASVAQALLPVLHAWDASALDTGNGFTGRVPTGNNLQFGDAGVTLTSSGGLL
jgi:hypothetical protein